MAVNIDRSFLDQVLADVDLVSLIEQKTPTRFGKAAGNGSKRTQKGPCPFCKAGTDRFAVFVTDRPQRYICGINGNTGGNAGCGARGDAINFLRDYEGLSFNEAVAELSGREVQHVEYRAERSSKSSEDWQSKRWQDRVAHFCRDAEQRLWEDVELGDRVLTYLVGRGFTEETIRAAHLGAASYKDATALVIPWYDIKHELYWRVTLRSANIGPGWRYENYPGSSASEGLYLADSLSYKRPVFLVEGELDALSIMQEACDLVSIVATGSTGGSRNTKWLMRIANAPHVFVAFDSEEKGEQSAEYWLKALPNATRWRTPIGKDANEMLVRDLNIRLWIQSAIGVLA